MNIDPIGYCLIRELDEAQQSYKVSADAASDEEAEAFISYGEYGERLAIYDSLSEDLIAHLLLIPSPDIDMTAYIALWQRNLALPDDDREGGKLWDAIENIARKALELYRGER